ncbi:MAG: hypothetical protein GXO57_06895, partial [Thermodesulfobacteria bacterium]|nr:hypothetical protein [Thermodesulfobacteriota bacterium]
ASGFAYNFNLLDFVKNRTPENLLTTDNVVKDAQGEFEIGGGVANLNGIFAGGQRVSISGDVVNFVGKMGGGRIDLVGNKEFNITGKALSLTSFKATGGRFKINGDVFAKGDIYISTTEGAEINGTLTSGYDYNGEVKDFIISDDPVVRESRSIPEGGNIYLLSDRGVSLTSTQVWARRSVFIKGAEVLENPDSLLNAEAGDVTIVSTSKNVYFSNIKAVKGKITIKSAGKIYDSTENFTIETPEIYFNAEKGVGSVSNPLNLNIPNTKVNAFANAGGIYIDSNTDIKLNKVIANEGNIVVRDSEGNIYINSSVKTFEGGVVLKAKRGSLLGHGLISATRRSLLWANGTIGNTNSPLFVDVASVLDIKAFGMDAFKISTYINGIKNPRKINFGNNPPGVVVVNDSPFAGRVEDSVWSNLLTTHQEINSLEEIFRQLPIKRMWTEKELEEGKFEINRSIEEIIKNYEILSQPVKEKLLFNLSSILSIEPETNNKNFVKKFRVNSNNEIILPNAITPEIPSIENQILEVPQERGWLNNQE